MKNSIIVVCIFIIFSNLSFGQGIVWIMASYMPKPPIPLEKYTAELGQKVDCLNLNEVYYLEFIVEEDGSLSNIKLLKGTFKNSDVSCISKIENALKSMGNWSPGKDSDGETGRVKYTLRLNEKLNVENSCISGDCRNGKGEKFFSNGDKYIGEWKGGTQHGFGTYFWKSGNKYEGDWLNGNRTGKGTLSMNTGKIFTGSWLNGEFMNNINSQNAQSGNNSNVIQNNSIINSAASDCKDKIIISKEIPSSNEYESFRLNENDVANEICRNSNNGLIEYVNKNGQTVGYCIYYFSSTGKRIRDETFDAKGRLMKQRVYDYTPNDKAKYMFILNYMGEFTSMRALESDGMRDVNFENPLPSSKDEAIYRYSHPRVNTKFTDMCQVCRGTGYGNNNLKRCYVCNGAGTITHVITKY